MPMPITIARASISMSVSTTLNFTLSLTPRRLIAAIRAMNTNAVISDAVSPVGIDGTSSSMPISRFSRAGPRTWRRW